MTDKQIIIDGVDVSKCAHYDKNADKEAPFLYDCKREHAPCWSCSSMPNCLYKKYKRKEQECESWKTLIDQAQIEQRKLEQQLEAYKMEAEEGKEINAELKAEQDRIKTICDNHFDEYEMGCLDLSDAIESLLERYDNAINGLTKQRKELKAENEKLKQYKEVVDKLAGMQVILTNENGVPQLYDNAKDLKLKQLSKTLTEIKEIAEDFGFNGIYEDCFTGIQQILQKISEVENEDN